MNLSKRYGDTLAVDAQPFSIQPGKVTGFLGPNGAGKSTTMRAIVGLDHPSTGTVTIAGRRYAERRAPLTEVGALLEAKAVHPGRPAYDHLLFLARSNGIPRRRVTEVLTLVGLDSVARKRSGGFSLGMGQRLGIAAALLGDPATLLFDEPVNGLDPEGIIWVRTLLRSLAAEGRTVFVSSHLMAEMALTADHLIVIGKGRLIADTTIPEFLARASAREVLVRTPQPDRLRSALLARGAAVTSVPDGGLHVTGMEAAQVGQAAADTGAVLHELTPQQVSLEEAFMELTRDSVDYHGGRLAPSRAVAGHAVPTDPRGGVDQAALGALDDDHASGHRPGLRRPGRIVLLRHGQPLGSADAARAVAVRSGVLQPDRAVPRAADHRGARRPGHLRRVLHRHDQGDSRCRPAAARHARRQGGGVCRGGPAVLPGDVLRGLPPRPDNPARQGNRDQPEPTRRASRGHWRSSVPDRCRTARLGFGDAAAQQRGRYLGRGRLAVRAADPQQLPAQ